MESCISLKEFDSPNLHLLVKKGIIILGRGPEEKRWRPSIDVLFRSAAVAYNTRAIGVVLTDMLDDGTTGMLAIKRSGGSCIVQDNNEAEYPDMPLSVLNNMEVDYCFPLAEMGEVIGAITQTSPEEKRAPNDVIIESQIAERVVVNYDNVRQLGEKSIYACPDCGGGLRNKKKDGDTRKRWTGIVVTLGIPIQKRILSSSRGKYLNLLYGQPCALWKDVEPC